jgi:hypothetical protein
MVQQAPRQRWQHLAGVSAASTQERRNMVRFLCGNCGHKLKASPDLVGQRCHCTRCGQVMKVPSTFGDGVEQTQRFPTKNENQRTSADKQARPSPLGPFLVAPTRSPSLSPLRGSVNKKARFRLVLGASLAAGLLAVAGLVVFLMHPGSVDQSLTDLKGGTPEARRQAVLRLAETDPDDSHRDAVTATLEPLLFEGDVRGDLSPDLVVRAYLHWAGPDNVPAMIRLVQTPSRLGGGARNAGLVMQALGKFQNPRAVDVLAEKLADPVLCDQAVAALRVIGPGAENAVLAYVFDSNPDTRRRASQLLTEYGTKPDKITGAALSRLKSSNPEAQRSAAIWFAENPPDDEKQQAEVAKALARLLEDLSPRVNALALHALKLWATRDCLPQLVAFARRGEKTGTCPLELIDVLARFPDSTAAEAIALQLKAPATRDRAVQALLKFGSVATKAVLLYIDYPDVAVQNKARWLCRQLTISTSLQLDQVLADVADARKPRAHTAIRFLARLRPDEANRARVSQALNAALLDPDPALQADALNAVRVWGSKANTTTLLKLLGRRQPGGVRDLRVIELLGLLQDPKVAPALAEGLTRREELDSAVKALLALGPGAEKAVVPYLQSTIRGARFAACWVLGEIGTPKSLSALKAAGNKYFDDGDFNQQTWIAVEKITARNQ